MSTCPNCKTTYPEGAAFCNACGTKLEESKQPQQQTNDQFSKKMHCPNCKSHNISISTETSISGAVSTHVGRFSSTSVSNTHRNYWFCSDCGTKFRNIQNLEEEIKKSKSTPYILWVLGAIAGFLCVRNLVASQLSAMGFFLIPYVVATLFVAVGFVVGGFVTKKKNKKNIEELQYLKENCFD